MYCASVSDHTSFQTTGRTESGCWLKSMSGPFCFGFDGLGAHDAWVTALGLKPRSAGLPKVYVLGRS